jgi:hypothetical protein
MNKKILIGSIVLAVILVFWGECYDSSSAWLRDANIAFSNDSIGIGWYAGLYLTAEKTIDKESSIGIYFLPKVSHFPLPINLFQITYNKQVIGKEEDAFAFSYYIGAFYIDYNKYYYPISGQNVMLDLGMAFRWRLNNLSVLKMQTFYFMPFFLEYSYKLNKNIEMALSFGYPFQIVSLRYMF